MRVAALIARLLKIESLARLEQEPVEMRFSFTSPWARVALVPGKSLPQEDVRHVAARESGERADHAVGIQRSIVLAASGRARSASRVAVRIA